jgi:TolB protein
MFSVVAGSACDFLPGGGGGTGGGGEPAFAKGFVFVRRDDKNLYLSDQRDFMVSARLTTEGGAKQPSFDKDGKRVVFVRSSGTDSEVDVVSTSGGAPTTLISSATAAVKNLRDPVFTPDGMRVVFAYDDGPSSSVGVVNSDGSGFQRLAGGGALAYSGVSMYPDGSAVLAAAGSSTSQLTQLERISTFNGQTTSVTNMLGLEATTIVSRTTVSPDGTQAAFDGQLGSGSVRIFVVDLMTKRVTQLTDYPGESGANDSAPCWMGTFVCFSSDTGSNDQIYALPSNSVKTSGGLQVAGGTEPWFGPN